MLKLAVEIKIKCKVVNVYYSISCSSGASRSRYVLTLKLKLKETIKYQKAKYLKLYILTPIFLKTTEICIEISNINLKHDSK